MKKLLFFACMFLVMAMPNPSHAVDMETFSCSDYNRLDEDSRYFYALWLDGYMSADANVSITDDVWINHLAKHLDNTCARQRSANIIDVANQVPYLDFEGEDRLDKRCLDITVSVEVLPHEFNMLIWWIDGYISGLSGDLGTNRETRALASENIQQICKENPYMTLADILVIE